MRVALLSRAFLPNVGGIETSSAMLAQIWSEAGHQVEIVTSVPDPAPPVRPYVVTRTWSWQSLTNAARSAGVVVTNGYSRIAVIASLSQRRTPVVFHQGYQLICTDGLGFRKNTFHGFDHLADLRLAFRSGMADGIKGLATTAFDGVLRRVPSTMSHVVPSHHVARRLGLGSYAVLYQPPNPAVMTALATIGQQTATDRKRSHQQGSIAYFGRLVFEKGVDDLIRAYAAFSVRHGGALVGRSQFPRLMIHGEGPERAALIRLVSELGVESRTDFKPFLRGDALVAEARNASVVVVPSRWEEPGATIGVELFACGVPVIVSARGALGEIFAEGGRLFPNGDVEGLTQELANHFHSGPRYPNVAQSYAWDIASIRRGALEMIR